MSGEPEPRRRWPRTRRRYRPMCGDDEHRHTTGSSDERQDLGSPQKRGAKTRAADATWGWSAYALAACAWPPHLPLTAEAYDRIINLVVVLDMPANEAALVAATEMEQGDAGT